MLFDLLTLNKMAFASKSIGLKKATQITRASRPPLFNLNLVFISRLVI
jgi:hypothetical protein